MSIWTLFLLKWNTLIEHGVNKYHGKADGKKLKILKVIEEFQAFDGNLISNCNNLNGRILKEAIDEFQLENKILLVDCSFCLDKVTFEHPEKDLIPGFGSCFSDEIPTRPLIFVHHATFRPIFLFIHQYNNVRIEDREIHMYRSHIVGPPST